MQDLIERLQPHIDNPGLERANQEARRQKRLDESKEKDKREQEQIEETLKEIEKGVAAIKKVLQNSCIITIAKTMSDGKRKGLMSVNLEKEGEKIVITAFPGASGLSKKSGEKVEKVLKIAMNQKTDLGKELKSAFGELAYHSHIKTLYEILSTDNVKVTYK